MDLHTMEEQYRLTVLNNNKHLRDAIRTVGCMADVNTPGEKYHARKYYYQELDNEFEPYRCFQIFFTEDPFWDHPYDEQILNRCWRVASDNHFNDILRCHSHDLYEVIRIFTPVFMKLFVLKQMAPPDVDLGHVLYNTRAYVNDKLAKDVDFKRHVLCHYIYYFYMKYHPN